MRQENNKGVVTGYRVPKPELWFVKMAYSPVDVQARSVGANGAVPLTNHYSFTDLNELTCRWTAMNGSKTLKSGAMKINCAPLQSVIANFPMVGGRDDAAFGFLRADGSSVVAANLPVEGAPAVAAPAAMKAGNAVFAVEGADGLRVGNNAQEIVFDRASGTIRSWRVGKNTLLNGGPILNLGGLKGGNENGYFQTKTPPTTSNARISTLPGIGGALRVMVVSEVKNGDDGAMLGRLHLRLRCRAQRRNARELDARLDGARRAFVGSRSETRRAQCDYNTMRWSRESYFLDYPAGHLGEPMGTATAKDVQFRASKRALHWLTFDRWQRRGRGAVAAGRLFGRARRTSEQGSNLLLASHEVAGVRGLSGSWVDDHSINARQGGSLSGSFALRALGAAR